MDQWQCRSDCPCRGCGDCTLCANFAGTPAGRKKTPCCIDLTMSGWAWGTCTEEQCAPLNAAHRLAGPISVQNYEIAGGGIFAWDHACIWRKCLATAVCGWDRIEVIYGANYNAAQPGDGWTAYLTLYVFSSTNPEQYLALSEQIKSPLQPWPDCSAWSQVELAGAVNIAYGTEMGGCVWGDTDYYGETVYISAKVTATEATDCATGCGPIPSCDACDPRIDAWIVDLASGGWTNLQCSDCTDVAGPFVPEFAAEKSFAAVCRWWHEIPWCASKPNIRLVVAVGLWVHAAPYYLNYTAAIELRHAAGAILYSSARYHLPASLQDCREALDENNQMTLTKHEPDAHNIDQLCAGELPETITLTAVSYA